MIRAHKIRLYPNDKQATYFAKACGTARFAYNWALNEWKLAHEAGENVSEAELRKRLNAVKHAEYPWMSEVTKCAPQLAIKNGLHNAIRNYYAKRAGFPKFRKKGVRDSFSLSNEQFALEGQAIRIPLLGWVRMAEALRFDGKIVGAAISRRADHWFVAVQVEVAEPMSAHARENQASGVDLGIRALATLSDGTVIPGAKAGRACEKKLRRLNQELSRRQGAKKGEEKSKNFRKTQKKLNRLYARMANVRSDQTHKLTSMLTQNYGLIGIEDLNVRGMMSNHRLARSVADMSFFEFRRQLEYKAAAANGRVIVADQWFPSSKMCHICGTKVEDLDLSVREWVCGQCGARHDRDLNASINLRNYAIQSA